MLWGVGSLVGCGIKWRYARAEDDIPKTIYQGSGQVMVGLPSASRVHADRRPSFAHKAWWVKQAD